MLPIAAAAQDFHQLRKAILQQQTETRSKIDEIEAQIRNYQQRFNKTNQKYEQIYKQYKKLQRELALRKQKIADLKEKQRQIKKEISIIHHKIEKQQNKLDKLIKNYKETLRYVYENGHTSQLALILSSSSLHQMMVRNYYLKKFEKYRKSQVADIRQTKKDLKVSQQQRQEAAQKNKKVLAEIKEEKDKFAHKTTQQQANVKLLRQNRDKIKKKLAETRKNKKELNSTLSQLIAREKKVRKKERQSSVASNKATTQEDRSTVSRGALPADPAGYVGRIGQLTDQQLANIQAGFAKQKGKLPWPVANHTISEHFGRHRNPVYGTVTPNLGIEIVTKPHAKVHVVHKGYVFAVRPLTGYGNVVFVSHGKYITAYGNLSRVTVRKNTILQAGQVVGYAGGKNSVRGASVFFMLRAGNKNVDPEKWLKGG
jgi:septal ring factor EnvC (AmiA/AmiB activator)